MSKRKPKDERSDRAPSAALTVVCAWLLPGLGHWWVGHRVRGAIIFVVITLTFWTGVAVGGVRSTVAPRENGAWVAAQVCMGPQALGAMYVSNELRARPDQHTYKAPWPASSIGVVYAGVAGLLNLVVILDVLARVETVRAMRAARAPPGKEDR